MKDRMVPLMGASSAFIFAAQRTQLSRHGSALWPSCSAGYLLLCSARGLGGGGGQRPAVLIFQCLVFQDGGLTALGANILNMALAGTLGGYFRDLAS